MEKHPAFWEAALLLVVLRRDDFAVDAAAVTVARALLLLLLLLGDTVAPVTGAPRCVSLSSSLLLLSSLIDCLAALAKGVN